MRCRIEKYSSMWFNKDAWTGRWISLAVGQRSCIRFTDVLPACEDPVVDDPVHGLRRRVRFAGHDLLDESAERFDPGRRLRRLGWLSPSPGTRGQSSFAHATVLWMPRGPAPDLRG